MYAANTIENLYRFLGPPPSVDQKVISMLREFFRKRPNQETVRAQGILKGVFLSCD